ncbi:MAG: class I SAM-dependent methyltransferase [Coriobacteriia bacterium]|nr:class I SAM-dependent methyltransferase [Coriobacteriia bacterium]MCL2136643.1 class I SAM-dependent methyltransferase [Coriobacteriia bacterium]
MALGWIRPEDYSFNSFLLLERFQIRLMMEMGGWRNDKSEWRYNMGVALNANPAVAWYFKQRCPECKALVDEVTANAPTLADMVEVRKAEAYALASVEDFVIYTTPEKMASNCDFIYGWDKQRLFSLVYLAGKTVLDVGAGSGRLAFAAAEKAAWVYASEPVGTLREFMRDKIKREGIKNVRVLDGLVTELPFPDDMFDVVMSGHVLGDDWDNEVNELARVCRPGGWLVDCPGDSERDMQPSQELASRGWEELHYVGSFGKDVYTHRKQVAK